MSAITEAILHPRSRAVFKASVEKLRFSFNRSEVDLRCSRPMTVRFNSRQSISLHNRGAEFTIVRQRRQTWESANESKSSGRNEGIMTIISEGSSAAGVESVPELSHICDHVCCLFFPFHNLNNGKPIAKGARMSYTSWRAVSRDLWKLVGEMRFGG